MKQAFLLFFLLLSLASPSQNTTYHEFGPVSMISRPVDLVELNDGTFLCLTTSFDVGYPPYNSATQLIHLSASGDSIGRLDIGNAKTKVLFIGFVETNKTIYLHAWNTRDSIVPHYSRTGVILQRYSISLSPFQISLQSEIPMETAFSVFTEKFKALNWYYFPALGYDAEICRMGADSGTGYKINEPGFVMIKQIIECADGGLYVLGDAWSRDGGENNDLFVMKLDKDLQLQWKQTYGRTKGTNPEPFVKPGTARPNYFIHKKIVNGDTIDEIEFRMVADTITAHSVELFRSACTMKDESVVILASHSLAYKYSEQLYLIRISPKGETMWEYLNVDTTVFERGTIILNTRKGLVVYGDRTSSLDKQYSEIFTKTFDANGRLTGFSEKMTPDLWMMSGRMCKTRKGYAICGYHFNKLRNPDCYLFITGLNKKGLMN